MCLCNLYFRWDQFECTISSVSDYFRRRCASVARVSFFSVTTWIHNILINLQKYISYTNPMNEHQWLTKKKANQWNKTNTKLRAWTKVINHIFIYIQICFFYYYRLQLSLCVQRMYFISVSESICEFFASSSSSFLFHQSACSSQRCMMTRNRAACKNPKTVGRLTPKHSFLLE